MQVTSFFLSKEDYLKILWDYIKSKVKISPALSESQILS